MSDKKNIQTNLLGRKARYARSWGPPIATSPMGKRWDDWGEIVVVRQDPTDGLLMTVLWPDGGLSHDTDPKMIEVEPSNGVPGALHPLHPRRPSGEFLNANLAEQGIRDCAIHTRNGFVVRICEWADDDDTHIEIHDHKDFDEGVLDAPVFYEHIEPGDLFIKGKLVKKG